MDLKKTTLSLGVTPKPISAYSTNHGKARATGAGATEVPRDSGGMTTGETGGNFSMAGMTKIPNNAGPTGTESGCEASIAAQESNGQ
jgi:hypothetical protein